MQKLFQGKRIKHIINSRGESEPFESWIIEKHLHSLAEGNVSNSGKIKSLDLDTYVIRNQLHNVIRDKITTSELDVQTSEIALGLYTINPLYEKLAARITISRHLKNVKAICTNNFPNIKHESNNIFAIAKILTDRELLVDYIGLAMQKYHLELESICSVTDNYKLSFRGFYMLSAKNYLLSAYINNTKTIIETPVFMMMRVAFSIVASERFWTRSELYIRKQMREWLGNISDEQFEKIYKEKQFMFKRNEVDEVDVPKQLVRELNKGDFERIAEIYNLLANRIYTHATPTLFNAGFRIPQYSSCFTMQIPDSITGIADFWDATAQAQKNSGGVGVFMGYVRATGSVIKGTNGISNGLVPLSRVNDGIGHYIDQGGGKRSGSIAPFIPDWHSDLIATLNLRKSHDSEVAKTQHKLYYGVILSDCIARRIKHGRDWHFFCPVDAAALNDLYDEKFSLEDVESIYNYEELIKNGFAFTAEYTRLIREGKSRYSCNSEQILNGVLAINAEAGVPYFISKDNINRNRAQDSIIHTSNLCVEITLPTNSREIGVCNLASINFKKLFRKISKFGISFSCNCATADSHIHENTKGLFVVTRRFNGETETYMFNEKQLKKTVSSIVTSLDRIIDINYYSRPEMRYSNEKRRPLGIGVMGLADLLCKLRIPFASKPALELSANIQESIYYFAVERSIELARELGKHEDFDKYPAAKGLLQPHLYEKNFKILIKQRKDWNELGSRAAKYGMRNSVLIALMPTGNTSNIMGISACFEPHVSNIYRWKSSARDLLIVNKYILRDALDLDLKPQFLKVFNNTSGNVEDIELKHFRNIKPQGIDIETQYELEHIRFKKIYRTTWMIKPSEIITMAAVRQPYIDQSQSMNLWFENINTNVFSSLLLGLRFGLKSLSYYMYSKASTKEQSILCSGCAI